MGGAAGMSVGVSWGGQYWQEPPFRRLLSRLKAGCGQNCPMPLTFPMTNTCINRGAGLQACGGRPRPPVPLREERVLEDPRRPGGPPHHIPQHFPKSKWHWAGLPAIQSGLIMKTLLGGFLFCATVLCQDGPALLHKMQKALGGADKIEKIRDFDQLVHAETWDRKGNPIGEVRKRTRWVKPNLLRLDQVGPGDTFALYFDGISGWEILPGKHLADLAGGELEFARRYLSGFALNLWLADRNPDYEVTSPAENVVRISARKIANDQDDITLDPVSGLPVKQASVSLADPAHPQTSENQVKEWMTVAEIKFPRRVWILHGGIRLADITTDEIKLNGGLRPADLALKPADLNPVLSGDR